VTLCKKGGHIKPNGLENVVREICANDCNDDKVTMPELEECAKIGNSGTVDMWIDQSRSNEETPTASVASATSSSGICDDISPCIAPFAGDNGIKISLSVMDIPFSWLKSCWMMT
jgi:hypothetical protein